MTLHPRMERLPLQQPSAQPGCPSQTPSVSSCATALCVTSMSIYDHTTEDECSSVASASPVGFSQEQQHDGEEGPFASPVPFRSGTPSSSSGRTFYPARSVTPPQPTISESSVRSSSVTQQPTPLSSSPRSRSVTPQSTPSSYSVRPRNVTPQPIPPSSIFSFSRPMPRSTPTSDSVCSRSVTPQPTPPSSNFRFSNLALPQTSRASSSLFADDRVIPLSWQTSVPVPRTTGTVTSLQSLHIPRNWSQRPLPTFSSATSAPEAVPVVAELPATPVPVPGASELPAAPVLVPASELSAAAVVAAAPTIRAAATSVAELPVTPGQQPLVCKAYDPRSEAMPERAFFTPAVQNALRDGTRMAKEAVSAIEAVGSGAAADADLQELLSEAKRLQVYRSFDTRTIGVLGSTGKGKSHLINSLLHVPGIALTSGWGRACTSIVTEYHRKRPGQDAPFVIEVEYLSSQEIEEHVRALVRQYQGKYLLNDTELEIRKQAEKESQVAWSTLKTAFGAKLTKTFEMDMEDVGAEDSTVQMLVAWANQIAWPAGNTDGFWTSTAVSVADCTAQTRRFREDDLWPFTKIIRIYLTAQLLDAGIVLVDLPGLEDVNLARMRATQEYITRCDNVLIVDSIKRALSDASTRSSIFYALSRHVPGEWQQSGGKNLNIAVVCTHTEDIDLNSLGSEWQKIVDDQSIAEISEAVTAANGELPKAKKMKIKLALIQARNAHVERALQETYDEYISPQKNADAAAYKLNVFCVSNKWYGKYSKMGNTECVLATQIPALRRHCYNAAADTQLSEAKHYLCARLPALLTSLSLWATSTLAQQRDAVRGPAADFSSLLARTKELNTTVPDLAAVFDQNLTACVDELLDFFPNRHDAWIEKATVEGRKWLRGGEENWHYTQYHAWCVHNGDYMTKRRCANWNASIIWAMRSDLEYQWDITLEEVQCQFKAVGDSASALMLPLKEDIKQGCTPEDAAALVLFIDLQLCNLDGLLDRKKRSFLGRLQATHRHTSNANYSSFVVQYMKTVYRKAVVNSAHLTGNKRRDVEENTVQGHIEGKDENGNRTEDVFEFVEKALTNDMYNLLDWAQEELHELLATVFSSIEHNIDVVHLGLEQRPAAPAPRDDALVSQLGTLADEAKRLVAWHERLRGIIANV